MVRLITRKVVHALCALFLVSIGITFLVNLTPGDPAYSILGEQATPQQITEVHKSLHLDDPFYVRYWDWLWSLLHGDFGTSFVSNQKVTSAIAQTIPVTAELVLVAFIMAMVLAVPIGVYCGYRSNRRLDRAWSIISSALISSPPFVSALLLIYVLALHFRVFPVTGWIYFTGSPADNLLHVFLPALTLALALLPIYSRPLRDDMVSTLQEDYILAARAKGLSTRRILLVHALRQSSFSLITLAGISLGSLLSGAAIVEVVFALPGLGNLIVNSISAKDIPMVQGTVMFIAVAYVLLNMLVDLAYSYLDPRVRLQGVTA